MKHLLIDTSTDTMILILQDDQKTIDSIYRQGKSDHQAFIVPLIEDLLNRNQLDVKDLESVVVGVGPGSYTGLRVGVMTAKMLGYASKVKIMKISSLLFLSSGYKEEKLVWHDARNNQGFSGGFKQGILTKEEKIRHLDDLSDLDKKQLLILSHETIKVDGAVILKYGEPVEDIYALIPNYLRKTEAESKLD